VSASALPDNAHTLLGNSAGQRLFLLGRMGEATLNSEDKRFYLYGCYVVPLVLRARE